MSGYFDNLVKLTEENASQIQQRQLLVGPGGIVMLTSEPDPPIEGVYILAIPGTSPVLRVGISGETHTLSGGDALGEVAGELELISEGETVTIEEARQLLLHGQLTVEGTLVINGTLAVV